jgi:hypothetical protein
MIMVSMEGQVGGGGVKNILNCIMELALHIRPVGVHFGSGVGLALVWVSPQIETGIEWCKGMRMPA